ncbi:hypothetical protein [Bacillus sp. Marseille-P3661]|uniref:hypothetical protein n=1 Tax=Bacillus sp. Marseille-P3661 TaxID=1936234 RepID=UPI000C85BD9E|nr:hypothetical protein [Bacillus sp. Marseille-P3661]
MQPIMSRTEKFSKPTKKSSLKKKVVTIVVAGTITLGAGVTFGASPLLDNVKSFIADTLGLEKNELSTSANTTHASEVTDFDTFLIALKNRITSELGNHNETKKTEVDTAITQYNATLQSEADAQATTDITAGKAQLDTLAATEIQEAKDALDSKYLEIFPSTTQQ